MSSIGFFLTLILMIVMALIIGGVIRVVNRRYRLYMNVQRTTWLLAGYGAMLLLAMVMAYVVSLTSAADSEVPYEELEKEYYAFYQAASKGNIEEITRYSVLEKRWDIPYTAQHLNIVQEDDRHNLRWLIVARKQESDGLIEAAVFRSRSVKNSEGAYTIDFTDKIPPLGIEVADGKMTITKPEPVELSYATFKKEFVINQFTGKGDQGFGSVTYWGDHVLFLQIPQDLHLIAPANLEIIYIGE